MAQEVERRLGKAEATGSNPVSSLRVAIKPRINKKQENSFGASFKRVLLFFVYMRRMPRPRRSEAKSRWRGFNCGDRKSSLYLLTKIPYVVR